MTKIQKQAGFTLIEILVVIGIIAILATIVLIAINPARQFKQARDTQRTSNVNAILNAIGQYLADKKGNLPPGVPAVPVAPATLTTADISETAASGLCAALVPVYIPALPVDPSTDPDGAGSLKQGEAVPSASCTSYNSGYEISRDVNDRITISATGEIAPTVPISVTR